MEDTTMDFEFEGERVSDEENSKVEETKEESSAETAETEEDSAEDTADETEEETEEDTKEEDTKEEAEKPPKKDNKVQALDSERAKRKQAEKKVRELEAQLEQRENAKKDEEEYNTRREAIKKKLIDKGNIDEDVIDDLMEAFGDNQIKTDIANERRIQEENFEKEFSKLKEDEMFFNADSYKPKIKELMAKGLTMEEAYFASAGKVGLSQLKKDIRVEIEQELLNTSEKADKVDLGHSESKSEVKNTRYTKREQEIANETGMDIKDVHKRSNMFKLEDMLNL